MTIKSQYERLESTLHEREVDPPESEDSLSSVNCSICGTRLTKEEWRDFEDSCEECMWNETSGIIDDHPEEEVY